MAIPDFDKVELLLPMTGANNGTVFPDLSLRKKTVSRFGESKTVTDQSKFSAYGSSGFFDGTGDVLEAPFASIGTKIRAAPFCIEMYIRPANVSGVKSLLNIINSTGKNNLGGDATTNDNSTQINFFLFDDKISVFRATGSTTAALISGTTSIAANQWSHVACAWDQTTLRVFLNGSVEASTTTWHDNAAPTLSQVLSFFGWFNGTDRNNQNFNGHAQDLCFTVGSAKYTANFTPPPRMTARSITRTNSGTDSHEVERAVLFDWEAQYFLREAIPDIDGDFVAADLIDLEYGVALITDGCDPVTRGPIAVDPD
jgi:hypothetical protein